MSEDFAELFASYESQRKAALKAGDKVSGTVISIGQKSVFVDCGASVDGIVDREELLNDAGELTVAEGDTLELYVVGLTDDSVRLSKALTGAGGLNMLQDAYEGGVPVEGKVKEQIKGGFHVEIMKRRAFCPVSQIDSRYVANPEDYVGQTLQFRITKLTEGGRNIVVSRRALLEVEQQQASAEFFDGVKPGDVVEGTVTRLAAFGAFVELVPGVEGLVHISEISWARIQSPDEALSVGDRVRVKYLGTSAGKKPGETRLSLSIKQAQDDPWKTVSERFKEGDKVTGKVVKLMEFGAFVEIAPGIEGLVHVSEMSYAKRIHKPGDVVQVGDMVAAVIKQVDVEKQRISLSMRDAEGDPWLTVADKYPVGQTFEGTVEKRQQFGLFVNLEPGVTGLLPQSVMAKAEGEVKYDKLVAGDKVVVSIESVNLRDRKISLGTGKKDEVSDWKGYKPQAGGDMGSLGDVLAKALKKKS
ncbi:30S ribosomal protein S1 [Desulfomicrobium escambiense]|uniref:30S ribosomal protein S1 n=1 Tax=Desulfomicrobium escambiense TaxID=29503 RepID=UPI00041EAB5C|nr:30S ribosomal protein S1 [Desulfomicrobium escambiense]